MMIVIWKTEYIVAAVLLVGIAAGLAYALAMMFFVLRTRNVPESAALSGMAQSVGYFIAACGPPIFGMLYGWTNSWLLSLSLLVLAAIILFFTGLNAAKDRYI